MMATLHLDKCLARGPAPARKNYISPTYDRKETVMNDSKNRSKATPRVSGDVRRPSELDRLDAFIGRWITEGQTIAEDAADAVPIVSSDVYEWAVGRRVIVHPVHGRIGDDPVGGLEVISFDPSTGQFRTQFYDGFGNVASQSLRWDDGVWTWQGSHSRCLGTFSVDGRTLVANHERSDDGVNWRPSMLVTLRRGD
jgi:hypothetical protein